MASLEEEGEIVPDCVTNFHFVNDEEEPISFSMLPLQWGGDHERTDGSKMRVFLCGTADGLHPIFKKVVAWTFDLSYVQPEIYVLSKEKVWIKLHKPRKSYRNTIKTVLVSLHCLHFMKKHPGESGEAMWNKMHKTFSTFDVLPHESDLFKHMPLLNKAAERDKDIAKSEFGALFESSKAVFVDRFYIEYLATLLLQKSGKRKDFLEKICSTKRSRFIVDMNDDGGCDDDNDDEDNDENMLFDHVCALCDNGGEVLCCEGRCIRSFHPTVDSGSETLCESLGYSHDQVEAMRTFLCKNCQYQQHQCFACGMLGSSDRSSGAEVFPCISATCGHFYHPKCVVELLHPFDKIQAEELLNKIVSGESFLCPVHKCYQCKQGEDKKIYELQFAICRRCPKAYHRKCLPRAIGFQYDAERSIHLRAWDDLLPNRILIYCLDHAIISELGTPRRDHLLFPDVDGGKHQQTSGLVSGMRKVLSVRRTKSFGTLTTKPLIKLKRPFQAINGDVKHMSYIQKAGQGLPKTISEPKMTQTMKLSTYHDPSISKKVVFKPSTVDKSKSSFKSDGSKSVLSMRRNTKQESIPSDQIQKTVASNLVMKKANSTSASQYAEMEKRMEALMKNATSSFNQEEFINKKRISINAYSQKFGMEKKFLVGVEASVEAVRAALKKLEEGGTVEEAKAVCEPEILNKIIRWKRKLGVYLSPFLNGMRYTSFGRHFTKLDKLKEVVNRLRWYVQDGDTIVDFCCGSNDFSCLMKEELDKLGKSCSFRNYDLIQPKNDFNFEKRDWMTVHVGELPPGSNLIMGLNPPFGLQASLANKFIDKALTFKPKLLILIVPKETERLDKKRCPYDLVWEDDALLSGKSFYLPGSLDANNQQMEQWNLEAPPLFLWSRRDWTAKQRAIAQEHGHINAAAQGVTHVMGYDHEAGVSNYLMEEKHDCYGDFSNVASGYADISKLLDDIPEVSDDTELESLA